ncbi:MAG TPA: glycosyl hydrolase [Verrucomicrobiae bacterium]|nr:glycosyl hydrolase [Verrucomicrobiae bacterium]
MLWLGASQHILCAAEPGISELEAGFEHPPDSARPWVYWFWIDGNVTKSGITQDLESMRRVGIGGALLMDVTQHFPQGPVSFGSPLWLDMFDHAVREAGRLGLELSVNNSGGWSGSGGPWITSALAMQKIVSSKTNLTGPAHFRAALPEFGGENRGRLPFATIAFPSPAGDGGPVPGFPPKRVTVNGRELVSSTNLFDHDPATFTAIPAPQASPQRLQLEFAEPFSASVLTLTCAKTIEHFQGKLEISDDGREFREIREFNNNRRALTLSFPPTSARFYQLSFTAADPGLNELAFSELEVSPVYRIPWYLSKSGAGPMPLFTQGKTESVPPFASISSRDVTNLTSLVDDKGVLTWDVPPGPWTILRFAYAPVGTENHTASPGGVGLECDKLSREAINAHFQGFLAGLVARAGRDSALKATHIDSWEIGFQNGTANFIEEFQSRRGYSPIPYLPTLTGRWVDREDLSERFLWDVRRTIADLVADNYAGGLAELAHQHGLKLSIEAYPSLGEGPFDELRYAGRADIPMAEFWYGTNDLLKLDLRAMPSAAHTYGKPIVAAEAFTSEPEFSSWQEYPAVLKPLADAAFCEGINRLVIHRFAHQPWTNRAPGMTLGPFGVHYERTQTWWEQSRPWHEYLARCQYLLQRGTFVADLCYVTPEGSFTKAPGRRELKPPPPAGYNYDVTSPEVVLNRMSVQHGNLILPDGMSYRVLIFSDDERMSPQLLKKVEQLVRGGAAVIARRPTRAPGLTGYPDCDKEVQRVAASLWGPCDGKRVLRNDVGDGTVYWGESLTNVLAARGVVPDFIARDTVNGSRAKYIHRRMGDSEVYFVCSPATNSLTLDVSFRVSGKVPELWHPDSGQIERPAVWHKVSNGTSVPLKLEPSESAFVVFGQSPAGFGPVTNFTRNGHADSPNSLTIGQGRGLQVLATEPGTYTAQLVSGETLSARVSAFRNEIPIAGAWELRFPAGSGAPDRVKLDHLISWTKHTNSAIKYFSGAAVYENSVELPADLVNTNRTFLLDLGRVLVLAELKVNDMDLGILWKPPFIADITRAIHSGKNSLQITVVNLWPNRLIGDEHLAEDCAWQPSTQPDYGTGIAAWPEWLLEGKPSPSGRLAFTTWKHWTRNSPLLESGLLGPVRLRIAEHRFLTGQAFEDSK